MKKFVLLAVAGGMAAACGQDPSSLSPEASGPVGALLVTAELDDPSVTRVAYSISAPDLAAPLVGELAVEGGVAQGQLSLPAGEQRTLEVSYRGAGGEVCHARARALSVEVGRTSQVVVIPSCGEASGTDRAHNKPPKIEAVIASRRSVEVGELVSMVVIASDANDDDLTYRWTENVAGFGFDRPRAQLTTWKAGPRAMAHNRVTITVQDGRGGTISRNLTMDFDSLALGAGTCAQPTRIKIGDHVRGFTRGASAQGAAGCDVTPGAAPEHVFRLDVPTRQDVSISVAGSAFFARVYVRKGACGAGPELACDGATQRIDLPQAAPGTYYIIVDGGDVFSQGEFQLTVFSGTQPEECRNFTDDDGDGALDCADSDCAFSPGCLECAFNCDPDPNDCIGGQCDTFSGRCNTFVRFGETCDRDHNPATADVCNNDGQCVTNTAVCGNGQVEFGEQCDDGNVVNGDGCSSTCQVVPVCGNAVPEFPEECDDGNLVAGDGCGPTCLVERCGQNTCDDGNPCTADVCTDAVAGVCAQNPVANGTTCDLDGSPETVDTCQAGLCEAPPTDDALIILDPEVLADPAFSLAAMHDRLAPDGDGPALFAQWANTLSASMTTNGRTVVGRQGWATFLAGLPRDTAGRFDLDDVGFLPSAMVNRFDLRTPGNCGENRLVFTKTSGATDPGDRGTIIFEFNVPDDGSNCRHALARWTALRALSGAAQRTAAVALLEDFANPLEMNTLRTNEFVNAPFWELREFHLIDGQLQPAPVVDSPPFELAQDPAFRSFVIQNAVALNHGAREIGIIPTQFLGAASRSDGQVLSLGNIVPSVPGLEANLNVLSCSGCHLTNTGTSFVHVAERLANRPSALSNFMRSELAFRAGELEAFLATP